MGVFARGLAWFGLIYGSLGVVSAVWVWWLCRDDSPKETSVKTNGDRGSPWTESGEALTSESQKLADLRRTTQLEMRGVIDRVEARRFDAARLLGHNPRCPLVKDALEAYLCDQGDEGAIEAQLYRQLIEIRRTKLALGMEPR